MGKIICNKDNKPIPYDPVLFEPAFAATVHKYQGSTISEPCNIRNTSYMTLNQIYVALSRFRNFNDIHIEWTDITFEPETNDAGALMVYPEKLKLGYIYRIYDPENDTFYVGKTEREIDERFKEHLLSGNVSKNSTIEILSKVLYYQEPFIETSPRELSYAEMKYIQRASKESIVSNKYLIDKDLSLVDSTKEKKNFKVAFDMTERLKGKFHITSNGGDNSLVMKWNINGTAQRKALKYKKIGETEGIRRLEEFRDNIISDYIKNGASKSDTQQS